MRSKERRIDEIKARVRSDGSCALKELAAALGVTTMTIRRDLDEIAEADGYLLARGVLFYTGDQKPAPRHQYSLISAKTERPEQKTRIAKAALGLLLPGDGIIIDAGSTMEYFVEAIPRSLELSVLCFSLNILMGLLEKPGSRVMLTGGQYHASSMLFESREAIKQVRGNRANKAFISASGVNLKLGVTCSDEFESELKRAAIESAQERILLVDSSKLGKVQTGFFAEVKDFDRIITDDEAPAELLAAIRELGVTVDAV